MAKTPPVGGGGAIQSLRPFVPARDFAQSQRFYADLGFAVAPVGDRMADVRLDDCAFFLQDFYVKDWAENFVFHARVDDLDAWWDRIASLDLTRRYGVQAPRPPKLEPWGLRVAYVFDPSGILWHFAEVPA
ncbi:VOC family protein [Microvirga lenta]|uniref:VOC family protein n=1 Tax=Microvirga lenta TaxID=2881337 RepID=UPI001CFF8FAB|nr:VOC family protein [Microvirga lenta]MCB5177020.1 VOC family protein [Microvirga lenta]